MLLAPVPMLDVLGNPLSSYVLLSFAIVGLCAAAYSQDKYAILTEYVPHDKRVLCPPLKPFMVSITSLGVFPFLSPI